MKPMKKMPFLVTAYPGQDLGRFVSETDALRIAQMWSARWGSWSEVHRVLGDGRGVIGQFDKGEPTPEFASVKELL